MAMVLGYSTNFVWLQVNLVGFMGIVWSFWFSHLGWRFLNSIFELFFTWLFFIFGVVYLLISWRMPNRPYSCLGRLLYLDILHLCSIFVHWRTSVSRALGPPTIVFQLLLKIFDFLVCHVCCISTFLWCIFAVFYFIQLVLTILIKI